MQVEFSRLFVKDLRKIPLDIQCSLAKIIEQVGQAKSIREISDCKKLQGATNAYRIRIRDYRVLLLLIQKDDTLFFQRIMSRGQIYKSS